MEHRLSYIFWVIDGIFRKFQVHWECTSCTLHIPNHSVNKIEFQSEKKKTKTSKPKSSLCKPCKKSVCKIPQNKVLNLPEKRQGYETQRTRTGIAAAISRIPIPFSSVPVILPLLRFLGNVSNYETNNLFWEPGTWHSLHWNALVKMLVCSTESFKLNRRTPMITRKWNFLWDIFGSYCLVILSASVSIREKKLL